MRLTTFGLYSRSIRLATAVVDRGWFGLTPLERHIVICGCPRGGTTLLHLMLSVAIEARTFGREVNALSAAQSMWRNQAILLTKRPNDIFELDRIRSFYSRRRAQPLFLVNIRDPRDVLVSKHSKSNSEYYVSFDRWRELVRAIDTCGNDSDVLFVRFEDLIQESAVVGNRISAFLGVPLQHPIESYHERVPDDFYAAALNGVRQLDTSAIGRWRNERHCERIGQALAEMPELADQLISWGYERDKSWIDNYATQAT